MVSTRGALDLLHIATPSRAVSAGKSLLYVKSDGMIYKKNSAGVETLVEGVKLTGNESIDGIKTFSSSPIGPDPTSGTQFSTKAYVDAQVSAMAPAGQELGAAERTTSSAVGSGGGLITGLSVTVTGSGRAVDIEFSSTGVYHSVANTWMFLAILVNGSTGMLGYVNSNTNTEGPTAYIRLRKVLTNGVNYTFTVSLATGAGGTCNAIAGATYPMQLTVTQR